VPRNKHPESHQRRTPQTTTILHKKKELETKELLTITPPTRDHPKKDLPKRSNPTGPPRPNNNVSPNTTVHPMKITTTTPRKNPNVGTAVPNHPASPKSKLTASHTTPVNSTSKSSSPNSPT
jgi:hypothetical protein